MEKPRKTTNHPTLECQYCTREFVKPKAKANHELKCQLINGEKSCPHCGKIYIRNSYYNMHVSKCKKVDLDVYISYSPESNTIYIYV